MFNCIGVGFVDRDFLLIKLFFLIFQEVEDAPFCHLDRQLQEGLDHHRDHLEEGGRLWDRFRHRDLDLPQPDEGHKFSHQVWELLQSSLHHLVALKLGVARPHPRLRWQG